MVTTILQNKTQRRAVIHISPNTTGTVQMSGLTANATTENVQAASITQVWWTGNVSISRGANVVFTGQTGTAGHQNFMGSGVSLSVYPAANLVIASNDLLSYIMVEVQKNSNYSNTVQMW